MNNEKKDKTIAAVGTVLVHALVVLVLFLMAFRTPLPLPGEEGVEVDLGITDQGMGDEQPDNPDIPEQSSLPQYQENETTESEEEILTQDTEEAPSLETEKEETPQKDTEIQPEETTEKPEENPSQTINPSALMKPRNPQPGGSEGNTDQAGDQGKENGLKDVKRYDGLGGQGNGESSGTGGPGTKKIGIPSNDFEEEGDIYVDLLVNREGTIVKAEIAKGTYIVNESIRQQAIDAALKESHYSPEPNRPEEFVKKTFIYKYRLTK